MKTTDEYRADCDVKGCENEVFFDDYGICVCEEHYTPEVQAALRRVIAMTEAV